MQINGHAFYICERQHNSSFERHNWHLLINNVHIRNHPEVITTASSKTSIQPCLFSNNTNCDTMIAILIPKSDDLNNTTIEGCTQLKNIATDEEPYPECSTAIRITITELSK